MRLAGKEARLRPRTNVSAWAREDGAREIRGKGDRGKGQGEESSSAGELRNAEDHHGRLLTLAGSGGEQETLSWLACRATRPVSSAHSNRGSRLSPLPLVQYLYVFTKCMLLFMSVVIAPTAGLGSSEHCWLPVSLPAAEQRRDVARLPAESEQRTPLRVFARLRDGQWLRLPLEPGFRSNDGQSG